MYRQLQALKVTFSEEIAINLLVDQLDGPFEGLKNRMKDIGLHTYTWDSMLRKFRDEQASTKHSTALISTSKNNRSKGQSKGQSKRKDLCEYCKLRDHQKDRCWYWNPYQAPQAWREKMKNDKRYNKKNEKPPQESSSDSSKSDTTFTGSAI